MVDDTRGNLRTSDMHNRPFGQGEIFTDADNNWGNGSTSDRASAGVDAHFSAEQTWDYYLTVHGRTGIKDDGVGALSRVHYRKRYNNAKWSDVCECMTYGDGDGTLFSPLVSLDVAGHEMTHGFDDQGAKFDANGNLVLWWTPEDLKKFNERTNCVVKQFDSYEAEPGLHQKGELVVGESVADLGGLTVAYAAYQKSLQGKPRPKNINGFTPEQRFFLGWAQVWAQNIRPEAARLRNATDPHPLARFRVNGPLSNMPTFAAAYACKEGDPMVRPPDKRCQIW